uniref:Uncharacterized protein n=1 Tax=Ciona savignyi TaxID=51511 RepID=H2YKG9_CIOSA
MRTFCGSDLPRTIISSGNVLRINLHSNNDARSHAYLGFMANVVRTLEAAYMPGDLPTNAPTGVRRPTLGGVLLPKPTT